MTTAAKTKREEQLLMPRAALGPDVPPERTCLVMEAELDALERDIASARRRAERLAAGGSPGGPRRHAIPDGERVTLAGGTQVAIRPVRPEDAGRLTRGHGQIGALSRYRRFLLQIDNLTSRQATFLSQVDHTDHEAFVALDLETGESLGVARYVRDSADPHRAQIAAVVADAWQGRGLGRALVERLAERARSNGIDTFTATTVASNAAARKLGGSVEEFAGTLHLTVRLPD